MCTVHCPQSVRCVRGSYLLQEASAVAGHGEVSQEREGELLDSAVIRGDTWGQFHNGVHQRVAKGAFRSWRNTRATATKSATCWEEQEEEEEEEDFYQNSSANKTDLKVAKGHLKIRIFQKPTDTCTRRCAVCRQQHIMHC